MRGFKGMNKDMTCLGFQYEIGKTYREDNIKICKKGFHFCKNLVDVFRFYKKDEGRFFEIEASGEIMTQDVKGVASEITVLRELEKMEVNRIVYGDGNGDGYGNGFGNGYGNGFGNGFGLGAFRFRLGFFGGLGGFALLRLLLFVIEGYLGVQRTLELRGHAAEFAHSAPDGVGDLGEILGAEDQKGDDEDDQ